MVPWAILVTNVLGSIIFFGGIALCVRFDQQGKTKRRKLEHAERMRAIELGRPLNDVAVARYQALGAVGVAAPIASLSAAAIGSCFALMFDAPEWRFATVAVVWVVCGAVCLAALPVGFLRLRESQVPPFVAAKPVPGAERLDI